MILALPLALALLWAAPTKTTDCHAVGLLPDSACTPGAVETTSIDVVCRTSTKGRRHVSRELRRAAFAEYGIAWSERGAYELDHVISLELGGANSLGNLFPQRWPEARRKDAIENVLHARVCSGAMSIEAAQRAIATDWTKAVEAIR